MDASLEQTLSKAFIGNHWYNGYCFLISYMYVALPRTKTQNPMKSLCAYHAQIVKKVQEYFLFPGLDILYIT